MLQDSSHRQEQSPLPRSDLADVVSAVTASQHERAMIQVSPQLDEHLSHKNSALMKMISKNTESEAVRLLAARIPHELFDDILFYVNVDRVSQRDRLRRDIGNRLARNQGQPSPIDILTDLKQCSLVCLFWANRCRRYMFSGRTLQIRSYGDAEIFRQYISGGSSRLMSVHQLVHGIYATQRYDRQRSFLHLLYLPAIQDKLKRLTISGPVPDGFNPAKLDTPHWGIPPYIVIPSSFLKNGITFFNVHLPSFYHIIKNIKHFSHATYISFNTITWNEQMAVALPYASSTSTIACQRRQHSLMIRVYGACTNSVHLAWTALMMNPNCPLHRLSDEEHVWVTKFMTLLWGDKRNPSVGIGFDVSEQTTTMLLYPFHFVFEEVPTLTDRSASSLSMVGMHAYIDDDFILMKLHTNFYALVHHARTHPTIRAFVLLFDYLYRLQQSLKPVIEVLTLAAETIELVLAYEEEEEHKAVSVDLVTLEPNGRIWTDLPESDRYEKEHLKSLHILERQLEKKPRLGRLH